MVRLSAFLILAVFTVSQIVGAAPGPSSATGNFRNVKDTMGLCVPDRKDEVYYKMGHCKSVFESFTKSDGCVKKKIDEIRKKFEGKFKQSGTPNPKISDTFGDPYYCPTKQNKTWQDFVKDEKLFSYLLMQFVSAVVIEESDWDIKNGGKGLMNITKAQMDDPKYACGCDITNSESRGGSPAGGSPGEIDGHQSIQCGAYIALHHASEDGQLFGGEAPKPGTPPADDPRRGASKIFKSLVSKPDPSTGKETNAALERVTKKLENFCEKTTFVNSWRPELMPDTDIQGLRN